MGFSEHYFEGKIPIFEKYLHGPARFGIEVGSWEGYSAVWLAKRIVAERLYCIDNFQGNGHPASALENLKDRFLQNIKDAGQENKVTLLEGNSQDKLKSLWNVLGNNSVGIAYIDGSHMRNDVLQDILLVHPMIESGGYIMLDDYSWGWDLGPEHSPKEAIDVYVNWFYNEIEVLERHDYLYVIRKK